MDKCNAKKKPPARGVASWSIESTVCAVPYRSITREGSLERRRFQHRYHGLRFRALRLLQRRLLSAQLLLQRQAVPPRERAPGQVPERVRFCRKRPEQKPLPGRQELQTCSCRSENEGGWESSATTERPNKVRPRHINAPLERPVHRCGANDSDKNVLGLSLGQKI